LWFHLAKGKCHILEIARNLGWALTLFLLGDVSITQ